MITSLNQWGEVAIRFAWPMLWQSSLLIAVLFGLDFALRRKVRAAVRYALWLAVLIKLVMPPSLALPTGLAWWLRPSATLPLPPVPRQFVVSYNDESLPMDSYVPVVAAPARVETPRLSLSAIAFLASGGASLVLFGFLVWRWRQVARQIQKSEEPSDELRGFFVATVREAGVRGRVRLRLTGAAMSPAVCGLIRPCVLLPRALIERFAEASPSPRGEGGGEGELQSRNGRVHGEAAELRAVLLHELMHVRRADVWVNCAQTLLQIVYWWHPLLWVANARIRRLREEAVDDAVMMALRDDADVYAPTLLEVARLAFHRPLASLGLVGILESKRALSRRIERLLDFQPPRRAGLSYVSVLGVAAFTCMAVPQGGAPPKPAKPLAGSIVRASESDVENPFQSDDSPFAPVLNANTSGSEATSEESRADDRAKFGFLLENPNIFELINADRAAAYDNTVAEQGFMSRVFRVDPAIFLQRLEAAADVPGAIISTNLPSNLAALLPPALAVGDVHYTNWIAANLALRRHLQSRGINLSPPKSISWGRGTGMLLVRASGEDMEKVETVIAALSTSTPTTLDKRVKHSGVVVTADRVTLTADRVTVDPEKREISAEGDVKIRRSGANGDPALSAVPTNWARNTRIETSKSRRMIFDWLKRTPLERASFGDVPLSEVISVLKEETRKLNPDTHRINFVFSPSAAPPAEPIDVAAVRIKNLQVLTNISLYETLNAVVSHADAPIKFTIEDYGVVFSQKVGNPPELVIRSFHLDPTTFIEGLEQAIGAAPGSLKSGKKILNEDTPGFAPEPIPGTKVLVRTNDDVSVSAAARRLFRSRGVDLDPPKNIFWRDRGDLLVRATKDDLDKIEAQLVVLNSGSKTTDTNEESDALTREAAQLIDAHRYEEAAARLKEAIKLNPTNRQAFRYANVIYEHGDPQARNILSINTNSETQINIRVKLVAIPKKASAAFWKGLAATNSPSGPDGIILGSTQAGAVLKSLKSQKGVEVLSEPQVTSLSGRQARIQVGQVQPVLMGVTNGDKEPHYNMTNFFSGQEVDLIAYAKPDSGAIQLTATNTLKEFLGYDDPGKERVEVLVGGKPTRVKPPLPRFRERKLAINATALDGQTLVLGRPQVTETVNNKGVKPVAKKEADMKDVVVFITPTLIDADGNPLRK